MMNGLLATLLLALALTPSEADALFAAARYREAGQAYLELLRSNPRDARLLDAMAQTLRKLSYYPQAVQFFQRELAVNPDDRRARKSLAATLEEGNAPDDARRVLAQLTTSDPLDAESWFLLGNLNYRTGYYEAAVAELDRALSGPAGPPLPWQNRARVLRTIGLVETGRIGEASGVLPGLLAIPENERDIDLILTAARVAYEDGRYEDALKQATRAVEVNSLNASAHFWRARIFQQQSRIPDAIGEAERSRQLATESPAPRNLLVRLYRKSGREADAAREATWLREHEAQAMIPATTTGRPATGDEPRR